MQDKIKCAVLDKPKETNVQKLKGHTTIELTNVKTGEVERYEDDNMFTQAISKMVNFCMTHAGYQGGITDFFSNQYWSTLLGGLLLFDTPVDEDALYPKAGNKMVGCGVRGVANSSADMTQMGTYNPSESDTSQPLTKKFVWDFSTEQANGNIACVCLTSYNAGYSGAGAKNPVPSRDRNLKNFDLAFVLQSNSLITVQSMYGNQTSCGTVGSTFLNFCIDSDNDLIYSFSVSVDKLRIATNKMSPEKFDLFKNFINSQPGNITEYEGSFSGGSYFFCFYNTDEQVLYFWLTGNNQSYSNNTSLTIYKFNMKTKDISIHCTFRNTTGQYMFRNIIFTGNFAYAVCNDSRFYKVNLTDMSAKKLESVALYNRTSFSVNISYIYNGVITLFKAVMINGSIFNDMLLDTSDDSVTYSGCYLNSYVISSASNLNTFVVPPLVNSQLVYCIGTLRNDSGQHLHNGLLNSIGRDNQHVLLANAFAPNNYLATINNLASPVMKTADKTMKVTYTITAEGAEV